MPHPLARFLKLERRRPQESDGAQGATRDRFEELGGPGPALPQDIGRSPRLELDAEAPSEPTFTRCSRCGVDNNKFSAACTHCRASLHTADQVEFNRRLWTQLEQERLEQQRALEERREAPASEITGEESGLAEQLWAQLGAGLRSPSVVRPFLLIGAVVCLRMALSSHHPLLWLGCAGAAALISAVLAGSR